MDRKTGIQTFTQKEGKLKVLSLPVDDGGCGWYRLRQPFIKLRQHELADVHLVEKTDAGEDVVAAIQSADIIMAHRGNNSLWESVREIAPDKPIIFDTDDYLHYVSPYSEHFKDWGTDEFEHEGKKIWQYGKAGFDQYRNRVRLVEYDKLLDQSDAVCTTTDYMADTLRQHNDTVLQFVNSINFDYWWPDVEVKRKQGEIRIGWAGGVSHYEDMHHVHKALNNIMKRYQNVKLVLVGANFDGLFKNIAPDRIEIYGWAPFLAHPYRMKMLGLDIGIAPLQDTEFNRNKSEVKFSEYGALKIPTIARNIPPYSLAITDEANGLLYDKDEDFEEKLSKLIEDPIYRVDLGRRAFEWVKANRNADITINDFYNGLVDVVGASSAQ